MGGKILFFLLLPTLALSCRPWGPRCEGSCTIRFEGSAPRLTGPPCDPGCRAQRCRNGCPSGLFCHGNITCTPRCARRYIDLTNPPYTIVRCWCIAGGSCDRCDCRRHQVEYPWEAEGFTPYDDDMEGESDGGELE